MSRSLSQAEDTKKRVLGCEKYRYEVLDKIDKTVHSLLCKLNTQKL